MTTDIETVACLLPYCDAMLMDNDCRALLLNIPTALRPTEAARVHSLNSRTEFLDYLRSIRASTHPNISMLSGGIWRRVRLRTASRFSHCYGRISEGEARAIQWQLYAVILSEAQRNRRACPEPSRRVRAKPTKGRPSLTIREHEKGCPRSRF
jgi:hypothetical protein